LILDRDAFDSNYVPKRRERAAKRVEHTKVVETVTRVDALAKQQALASFDLEMPMGDGRVLGDWTIAELRTLNGAFGAILDRVGDGNDSRRVRDALASRKTHAANRTEVAHRDTFLGTRSPAPEWRPPHRRG